jgi:hypothetical protein
VIPADNDGGSGSAYSGTPYSGEFGTGPQTLKVDPPSIPGARDAFNQAADQIEALVAQLSMMDVPPWAGDPVSKETAARFASGSGDRGRKAAVQALTKYGEQLRGSARALQTAHDHYVAVEGTNTAKWKGKSPEDA